MTTSPNLADKLAAAAEQRTSAQSPKLSAAQEAAEHEKRQTFRRLIDPGITRPNPKEQAFASLKTLLTIAENLIREPDNPKFRRFKPTNGVIKRNLVDPKGALEYAIELGFYPEVENFQPYYTFNPRKMPDLRIGAAMLKEAIDLQAEKNERLARAKREEKAVAAAAAQKVRLAFMDDRKSKMLADERERQAREARALAAAHHAELQERERTPEVPIRPMPGSGHLLNDDGPPPYDPEDDDD